MKTVYKGQLITVLSLCANAAVKKYPPQTRVGFPATNEASEKLLQKLFEDADQGNCDFLLEK